MKFSLEGLIELGNEELLDINGGYYSTSGQNMGNISLPSSYVNTNGSVYGYNSNGTAKLPDGAYNYTAANGTALHSSVPAGYDPRTGWGQGYDPKTGWSPLPAPSAPHVYSDAEKQSVVHEQLQGIDTIPNLDWIGAVFDPGKEAAKHALYQRAVEAAHQKGRHEQTADELQKYKDQEAANNALHGFPPAVMTSNLPTSLWIKSYRYGLYGGGDYTAGKEGDSKVTLADFKTKSWNTVDEAFREHDLAGLKSDGVFYSFGSPESTASNKSLVQKLSNILQTGEIYDAGGHLLVGKEWEDAMKNACLAVAYFK